MSRSPSPTAAHDAGPDFPTASPLLKCTPISSDERFSLQKEEVALQSDDNLSLEDSSFGAVPGNDAELRVSADFDEGDHSVDPNERLAVIPDEGPPASPHQNRLEKNTQLQPKLSLAASPAEEGAPIPLSQISSFLVDDEIAQKIGQNQSTHHALAAEDSNTNRALLDRAILDSTNVSSSVRSDRNALHISDANTRSADHLARSSSGLLSQVASNELAPTTRDTADPSSASNDTRHVPNQDDDESDGDEGEEEIFTIPEAFLVRETIDIPLAHVVQPVERADHTTISHMKRRILVLTVVIVALVAIAVGISFYVMEQRNRRTSSAQPPDLPQSGSLFFEPSFLPSNYPSSRKSSHPSTQPSLTSVEDHITAKVLQRNVTFDGMDPLDPRKMALDWITKSDNLQLDTSDANLHQRYVLSLLVYCCSEDNYLGWLSDNNECEWSGVTCRYGNVIMLELGGKMMKGGIPPEIGTLEYLEVLDLSSNSLSGTLPPELGNLRNLTIIKLQFNYNLSGSLPSEVGGLQVITIIDLRSNNFTGSLPTELGNASALNEILMTSNKLTGPLPTELGKLSQLKLIHLGDNDLSGTLPRELGNLEGLTQISLYSNSLSGSIPSEIGKLRSLETIDMNTNLLTGTLPSELEHLSELTDLNLHHNTLTGTLPTELGTLSLLTLLDLYQNQFAGTIPNELGNLTALTSLSLSVNQFTGTIPSSLGNSKLQTLSLSNNHFNGSIPTELGLMSELTVIWLYSNTMTGTLPSEIGQLKRLTDLWIQDNSFSGTLPSELGSIVPLTKLALHTNMFTGSLPSDIGNLNNLLELYIYRNKLTGPLPSEIGRLQNLQNLGGGINFFNGTLPSELGNLKELYHLGLDNNRFTGTLPTELIELQNLNQLRLNGNQFTGPYLSGLRTCTTGMTILCFKSSNNFTGDLPMECDEIGLNCWDSSIS